MSGEVSYDVESYETIKTAIADAKESNDKLISLVSNIKSGVDADFKGEAKTALSSMLSTHKDELETYKSNWEELIKFTEDINTTTQENDVEISKNVLRGNLQVE